MPGQAPVPEPHLRVGIADLFSPRPDSTVRAMFGTALRRAAVGLGCAVELRVFGVTIGCDPASCGIDWALIPELDGLIITGSEPTREDIADEPVLGVIERLLGERHSPAVSTIFSCQSAHAALHLLHGVRRTRLGVKKTGVFAHHSTGAASPLTDGFPAMVPVPHSRWNMAPVADLGRHAVVPLLTGQDGDWHLAASHDGLRQVFLQGHPEYLPDTLMREYRRDLKRFRAGALPRPPGIPAHYLTPHAERRLRLAAGPAEHDAALVLAQHEMDAGRPGASWLGGATRFFVNWLRALRNTGPATPRAATLRAATPGVRWVLPALPNVCSPVAPDGFRAQLKEGT
jgi:homoserine O-succinyltransferase